MRITTFHQSILAVLFFVTPFAAAQNVPAWMKPGLRVTYFQGSATIPVAGQVLEPGENGGWVNSATGQRFDLKNNAGTGGGGITQLNFLYADQQTIAVETRSYALMDPAQGKVSIASNGRLMGTGNGLSEYWLPPSALAAIPNSREGGVSIMRMQYPLGGKTYNAWVKQIRTGDSITRYTFDMDSGLLLVLSTSAQAAPVLTPNANGTAGYTAGGTMITSTIFLGSRQVNVPWLNDRTPQFIKRGTRLDFNGTFSTLIPYSPVMAVQHHSSLDCDEPAANFCLANFKMANGLMLAPQEAPLILSAATTMPSWVNPQTVQQLAAGQVVDEDPITGFRTISDGVRDNVFCLHEEGPFDLNRTYFSMQSGLPVDIDNQQQNGVGRNVVRIQLAPMR